MIHKLASSAKPDPLDRQDRLAHQDQQVHQGFKDHQECGANKGHLAQTDHEGLQAHLDLKDRQDFQVFPVMIQYVLLAFADQKEQWDRWVQWVLKGQLVQQARWVHQANQELWGHQACQAALDRQDPKGHKETRERPVQSLRPIAEYVHLVQPLSWNTTEALAHIAEVVIMEQVVPRAKQQSKQLWLVEKFLAHVVEPNIEGPDTEDRRMVPEVPTAPAVHITPDTEHVMSGDIQASQRIRLLVVRMEVHTGAVLLDTDVENTGLLRMEARNRYGY